MRTIVLLRVTLVVVLASCTDGAPEGRSTAQAVAESLALSPDTGLGLALDKLDSAVRVHLQSISPRVGSDTLHLYSPSDHRTPGPMVGKPVGLAVERYLGSRFGLAMSQLDDVFAIGWAQLPPSHEVYLLRTPSQYDASAITLWLYDSSERTWRGSFELADHFGDEGWSFDKQAWMREVADSGDIVFTIRRVDRDIDIDNENANERIGPDSLFSFSVRGWIRRTIWTQQLPESLRARFPLVKHR